MYPSQPNYGYHGPTGDNMMPPFGFESNYAQYDQPSSNFYPNFKYPPSYPVGYPNQRQSFMQFLPENTSLKQNERTNPMAPQESNYTGNMPSERQWTQNFNRIHIPAHKLKNNNLRTKSKVIKISGVKSDITPDLYRQLQNFGEIDSLQMKWLN